MARLLPFGSRASPSVVAALLSILLHVALTLVLIVNGAHGNGTDSIDAPISQLTLLSAPEVDRREGVEHSPLATLHPVLDVPEPLAFRFTEPSYRLHEPHPLQIVSANALVDRADPPIARSSSPIPTSRTVAIPEDERSELVQQLAQAAERLVKTGTTQAAWQSDAQQFNATLVYERAKDGTMLDRVIADVTSPNGGEPILRIRLKRLAFSHYAQVVDHWDPNVQMHDDAIDGRVHINSRFSVMHDGRTAPQLTGKVSTAARGFNLQGPRRERDIFRGGIETNAGRIAFPEQVQPFAWASPEEGARIHECPSDTRIRFHPDGTYTWLDLDTRQTHYRADMTTQPVYFLGARGATLYVKGVVSGSVLIYSPERIVIEGSLTYARDPREDASSTDYLGLVSDGTIQVAPARITGREDLDVHAAILARRRFLVTDIEYPRTAMLRIFGSLSAGTLSATEPRYSTKLEFDRRFEHRRPPGFPSTDRFAVEDSLDTVTADAAE